MPTFVTKGPLTAPVNISDGGTGGVTVSEAQTNLELSSSDNVRFNSIGINKNATGTAGELTLNTRLIIGNLKIEDDNGEFKILNGNDHKIHNNNNLKHLIYDPSSQKTITLTSSDFVCIQNFKTSFTTPPGCTEVVVEAGVFYYPGSNTALGLALSSNSNGTTYTEWSSVNGGRNTERQVYYTFYSSRTYITTEWHLTNLSSETTYDINLGFNRWTGSNTSYVMIGGATYPKGYLKIHYNENGKDTSHETAEV